MSASSRSLIIYNKLITLNLKVKGIDKIFTRKLKEIKKIMEKRASEERSTGTLRRKLAKLHRMGMIQVKKVRAVVLLRGLGVGCTDKVPYWSNNIFPVFWQLFCIFNRREFQILDSNIEKMKESLRTRWSTKSSPGYWEITEAIYKELSAQGEERAERMMEREHFSDQV